MLASVKLIARRAPQIWQALWDIRTPLLDLPPVVGEALLSIQWLHYSLVTISGRLMDFYRVFGYDRSTDLILNCIDPY